MPKYHTALDLFQHQCTCATEEAADATMLIIVIFLLMLVFLHLIILLLPVGFCLTVFLDDVLHCLFSFMFIFAQDISPRTFVSLNFFMAL